MAVAWVQPLFFEFIAGADNLVIEQNIVVLPMFNVAAVLQCITLNASLRLSSTLRQDLLPRLSQRG